MGAYAERIAVDQNFQRNQIQNVVFQPLSAAPSSPVSGLAYYDTTLNQFGVYQNSGWVYLSAASGANVSKASNSAAANTLQVSGGTDKSIADYAPGSAGLLKTTTAGVPSVAVSGTDYAPPTATTSALKGNGSGGFAAATLNDVGTPTANYALGGFRLTNVGDPSAAQDVATKNYVDVGNSSQSTADRARANHTGTQTASTISDFDTQVRTSRLDQLAAPTTNVSLNGQRISSLADPTAATDAVTKQYADNLRAGLSQKDPVRVASTGNINLSAPGATIDGVTMVTGDRFLAKDQTTSSEKGIYVWNGSSAAATRATDADSTGEIVDGTAVWVQAGSTNGDQRWVQTGTGPITIGTTAQTWTMDFAATTATAGTGLAAGAGNSLNVGQGTGITVGADTVSVDTTTVPTKYKQTIGDGTATSIAVTHNRGDQDVVVSLRDTSTNELVRAQVIATSANVVTINFNTAPAANSIRVTVHA